MQFLAIFGLFLSILILLGFAYFPIRKFRARMSGEAFRHMYVQRLMRTAGWAVGAYLVSYILLVPVVYIILHDLHVKGY